MKLRFNKVLDKQDLKLSKKLITSYKKRLEKEILDRSMKLRMPQNKFEEIIQIKKFFPLKWNYIF